MTTGKTIMEREEAREETIKSVRKQFSKVEFPTPVLEPIFFGRFDKTQVIGKRLILDKETGQQWDVVSEKYTVFHHEEVVNDMVNNCPEEYGKPNFKINFCLNKARMDAEIHFPDLQETVNGSKINPMVRIKNSYNRTKRLSFEFGAYELVCTNGLVAFKQQSEATAKHIYGSLHRFQLDKMIHGALSQFSEQKKIWEQWSKQNVSQIETVQILEALPISKKEVNSLSEIKLLNHEKNPTLASLLEKKKATLWSINSAATQYATSVKSDKRKIDLQAEIAATITKFQIK